MVRRETGHILARFLSPGVEHARKGLKIVFWRRELALFSIDGQH